MSANMLKNNGHLSQGRWPNPSFFLSGILCTSWGCNPVSPELLRPYHVACNFPSEYRLLYPYIYIFFIIIIIIIIIIIAYYSSFSVFLVLGAAALARAVAHNSCLCLSEYGNAVL
jgi:hypothetical protein